MSCTDVVSSTAFSPLPKRTTTCVESDPSDSWPAVVCDIPTSGSVGLSSLEHTNFSPPSCITTMGVQLMYALIQFLFIMMSEYSLRLGDTLKCGDLGCVSGSHSSLLEICYVNLFVIPDLWKRSYSIGTRWAPMKCGAWRMAEEDVLRKQVPYSSCAQQVPQQ